jgi:hypothetical protein
METLPLISSTSDYNVKPKARVQARAEWEGTGGNSIEDYSPMWWKTFDLVFLVGMFAALWLLVLLSVQFYPEIFTAEYWPFWVAESSKVVLESAIGFVGGLVVAYWNIKVNYTRKIQHLFAYLLPLLFRTFMPTFAADTGLWRPVISAFWGVLNGELRSIQNLTTQVIGSCCWRS